MPIRSVDAIFSPLLARKFASLVIENAQGSDELNQQLPLTVEDQGKTWGVKGHRNADRKIEGPGPCYLEIQKHDARLIDVQFSWVMQTAPEIKALLQSAMNARS